MQKALKITGIIFGILLIIGAAIFILFGAVTMGASSEVIKNAASNAGISEAEAMAVVKGTGTFFLVSGIWLIPGAVLSFLAAKFSKDDNPSKAKLITTGVLNIVFGSAVVGVLSIVHGAKNGK